MREPTVADRIAAALAHRIIIGDLAPGERLRQDALAFEYNASQAPVREAFLRLEAQRLVVSRPRRGLCVAPIEPHDEREIVAMRSALEVLALRHVRVQPGGRQLAQLDEALMAGYAARDLSEWEASNRAFHVRLAELSGMPRLIASISDLTLAYSRHVFSMERSAHWTPRSNHDHQQIYEAILQGDITTAAIFLENHIWAAERLRSRPPSAAADGRFSGR
jgi:DNA-binding GntR family transcriptional regulator